MQKIKTSCWLPSPKHILLGDKEVHLWQATQAQQSDQLTYLWHLLSKDEQDRAKRFYFEKDRHYFIMGRGILRILLSQYLKILPRYVNFSYTHQGKPFLADSSLYFNVTHSHEKILYAMTMDNPIGIDIEWLRPISDAPLIAARFFSRHESAELSMLPADLQQKAFFNCWTQKEAFIKACGTGVFQSLDRFEVPLFPEDSPYLLEEEPNQVWTLKWLFLAADYVGAVALQGSHLNKNYCQWNFKLGSL